MLKPLFYPVFLILFIAAAGGTARGQMQWVPMGQGVPCIAESAAALNDTLYVASFCGFTSGTLHYWDGAHWTAADSFTTQQHPNLHSLHTHNGALYLAGYFEDINNLPGTKCIAKYTDRGWAALKNGFEGSGLPRVTSQATYNGQLYVGGSFSGIDGRNLRHLVRWNGTGWDSLVPPFSGYINAMAVYQGELYIAGQFDSLAGLPLVDIARFDGSAWHPVGNGLQSENPTDEVAELALWNNDLVAYGGFDSVNGQPCKGFALWDGTQWRPLGTDTMTVVTLPSAMVGTDSLLYAGGYDIQRGGSAPNSRNLSVWDGERWQPVGQPLNGSILDLFPSDSGIVALGYFDSAGTAPMPHVARLTGSLAPVSRAESIHQASFTVNVSPNPSATRWQVQVVHSSAASPKGCSLQLYDLNGRLLRQYPATPLRGSATEVEISAEGLPGGVYFLRIQVEDEMHFQRLLRTNRP